MTRWTTQEVAAARDAVAGLLDGLGLEAFLFQVEPADDHWQVKLEYANEPDRWTTLTLTVEHRALLESLDQPAVREALLAEWGQVVSGG